mmetsp:Transcript_8930/g.19110  ORF Transcript_8930/g.19110 Transcript_8930/m.19110 type:complete len:210 (-) Transcript_8930:743-1372(-)
MNSGRLRVTLRMPPQVAPQLATPRFLERQCNLIRCDAPSNVVKRHCGVHTRRSGSEDLKFKVLIEPDELPQLPVSVLAHKHVLLILRKIQPVQMNELLKIPRVSTISLDGDALLVLHQVQGQQEGITAHRSWEAQLVLLRGEYRAGHSQEGLHGCLGDHFTRQGEGLVIHLLLHPSHRFVHREWASVADGLGENPRQLPGLRTPSEHLP